MLYRHSSPGYQRCVYHHIIPETITLALSMRASPCAPLTAVWLLVGTPANLAFLLSGWTNSRAFLSLVEGVGLQAAGPHPGTDLSQARQKAGDGVNCLWCKDNAQQHVAQIPVVTQTPPAV